MKASILVLDPQGDTELILRRPNLNIEEKEESSAEKDSPEDNGVEPQTNITSTDIFCDRSASLHKLSDLRELKPYDDNGQSVEIRFRVSSPHLILASPVFKAMLDGPFREATRNSFDLYEIKAFEWSAEALLVLLDIIHGHHRSVPKTVETGLLEQVAVLVDYYQCHEIVEVFADKWVEAHQDAFPKDYGKPCMFWMFVAWVYGSEKLFNSMVSLSVRLSTSPVQTNLPIPNTIIEKIESRRLSLIDEIIDNLYGMLESLWATNDGCTAECSCMLLGSLMKQMRAAGFDIPRPEGWRSQGKCVIDWREFVAGLDSPAWRPDTTYVAKKHDCTFKEKTRPWMNDMARTFMGGIEFRDFQTGRDSSTPNNLSSSEGQ